MKKILLLITLIISITSTYGQGWTTCSTTSGKLTGTSTDITIDQSTSTPIYSTSPSPTGTIPQNGFLFVLHDSVRKFNRLGRERTLRAPDGGNLIIHANDSGIINLSQIYLRGSNNKFNSWYDSIVYFYDLLDIDDTISVVSFSYDIQQFKLLIQGIQMNSVPFVGTCCSIIDMSWSRPGLCDSLTAVGFNDSSDVNTIRDVLELLYVLGEHWDYFPSTYNGMFSLRGLNNDLVKINKTIGTLSSIGCTNNVSTLCYAFDSLTSNHDKYIVTSSNIYDQGWTTCSTTSGTLSGTSTDIAINQSTSTPIYATSPSPTGTIPQNDFLIVLHDSVAFDKLGNTIINSNNNGIINPSSLGLNIDDTISVVSFSYDIQQFKLLTQGLLMNSVPFVGTCCGIFDSLQPIPGICDTLLAVGINDSSDVNTIQDVLNIVSIFKYGKIKPMSLRGLNNGLVKINESLGLLNNRGCTNEVTTLCYAFDSLTSNHDKYIVTSSNIYVQGWTTCSTTSGTLSGTSTDIAINQSTSTPIYAISPSPTGTIPQNDFLIVLHDSVAFDNLGNTIINSNNNGIINPSSLGLNIDDTISVVSFSYDIQQFKLLTQGLLMNSVPFIGTCCSIFDHQQPIPGICDTLIAIGINDSSNVNTIQDVLNIVSIFKYGKIKPMSLRGLNNGLVKINETIGTLNSIGCANEVVTICYALDSLTSNHDKYIVTSSLDIIENNFGNTLLLYPNPTDGNFSVDLGENLNSTIVTITDLSGKIIQLKKYNDTQLLNIKINEPAGVYLMVIESENKKAVIRLIKE